MEMGEIDVKFEYVKRSVSSSSILISILLHLFETRTFIQSQLHAIN